MLVIQISLKNKEHEKQSSMKYLSMLIHEIQICENIKKN